MDWFDSWALTLATFLPMVGCAVVLADPEGEGRADQAGDAAHHRWPRWPSA